MSGLMRVRLGPPLLQGHTLRACCSTPDRATRRRPPQGVVTEGLKFRLVDAKGEVVGRLASQIAQILMGKDKPTYAPWRDDGDVVVVINAAHIEFTGRKWDSKLYRWHTGYPGGLKERTARDQFERKPDFILREAVLGMLPKNNLRRVRRGRASRARWRPLRHACLPACPLTACIPPTPFAQSMARKLRISPGESHPFEGNPDLVPFEMPPRKLRQKGDILLLPPGFEPLNPDARNIRYVAEAPGGGDGK